MTTQELIKECKHMIAVPKTVIFFYDPIIVRPSPKMVLMEIYACVVSIAGELSVMNEMQLWHTVENEDVNTGLIAKELYLRLKTMLKQAA